jgi:sugar phosphate isomerase/epimerase
MKLAAMCAGPQGFADGNPAAALEFARARGLDGILFPTPRTVSPGLDDVELKATRDLADDLGLFLEVGVGCLGPFGDEAERLEELENMVHASVALGCTQFFAYTRSERRHAEIEHEAQLRVIDRTIAALVPLLRGLGCRLNVKTHEDLSSHDVLRLVDGWGTDVVGVSLDVANLVVRGEDPVAATRRLAPYVHQTHLEDVALFFVETGLRRRLRPCGEGVIDWAAIVRTLVESSPARSLTLEQHLGRFDTEVFDPQWFESEPHVSATELGVLVSSAVSCENRAAAGQMPGLAELSLDRTDAERRAELDTSARYLRGVLDAIQGGHSGSGS